jgi:hypothetical protein
VSRTRAFAAFWWDFIVGDDWRLTTGLSIALALTALLAHNDMPAWWFDAGRRHPPPHQLTATRDTQAALKTGPNAL